MATNFLVFIKPDGVKRHLAGEILIYIFDIILYIILLQYLYYYYLLLLFITDIKFIHKFKLKFLKIWNKH